MFIFIKTGLIDNTCSKFNERGNFFKTILRGKKNIENIEIHSKFKV